MFPDFVIWIAANAREIIYCAIGLLILGAAWLVFEYLWGKKS